jgi:alkylhydroperoxidase/carboxymuconolactone decarboxylase family protein YurZ
MELNAKQKAFKEAYIRSRGYWVEFNDGLLQHSPEWLEAYLEYAQTPARDGPIEPRLREMIYVAIDASTTHMFTQGLVIHIKLALAAGCSAKTLVEVLQIATMQGIDSVAAGMPILLEEAAAAGIEIPDRSNMSPALERYKSIFGNTPDWLNAIARIAPKYADTLIELLATAEQHSDLTKKEKALIRLALASAPTHLNHEAMRTETRNALSAGATPDEITEVFQLVAHLGIHACVDGVPAIVECASE